MRNITVSVDDDLYRRARVRAAEEGTTVSAVVKGALRHYTSDGTGPEVRARTLRELFDSVDGRLRDARAAPAPERGWRDRIYDERFDQTQLGRALSRR